MPSKSEAQHAFMEAAAHDPKFAKMHHISKEVAAEFIKHDVKDKSYKKRKKVIKPK